MENKMQIFDNYINDQLSDNEKREFDARLKDDKSFRDDFRLYLLVLRAVCLEEQEDNMEFGFAMNAITVEQLDEIMGRKKLVSFEEDLVDQKVRFSTVDEVLPDMLSTTEMIDPDSSVSEVVSRPNRSRSLIMLNKGLRMPISDEEEVIENRDSWLRRWTFPITSIAAAVLLCLLTVAGIHRSEMNRVDNIIVAYNYIPVSNRGSETIIEQDVISLVEAYKSAPTDDVQAQEDAGMRLAMGYLKVHDRKKAKEVLNEMTVRFADDEEFVAQCRRILDQLK